MTVSSVKNSQSVGQKQRVKIFSVDPASRTIHATLMREGAGIQVAVWETGAIFRWPQVGEIWTVYKGTNGIWMLDKPVETADTTFSVEDMNPGDARIDSDVIKTASGNDVVITDQTLASDGNAITWNQAGGAWIPSQVTTAGIATGAVTTDKLAQMPQCRVFQSGAGGSVVNPILNSTFGVLTFNSERYDLVPTGLTEQHSTSANTSRLTCRVAGLYSIGGFTSTGVATGGAHANLVLNGVTTIGVGQRSGGVAPGEVAVATQWRLVVGDYVEMWLGNNTGGNVTVPTGSEFWFSWHSP